MSADGRDRILDSDSDEEYDFPELPDCTRFPSQEEVDATLPPEGFIVYKNFVPEEDRKEIEESFLVQVLWYVYTRAGVNIDFEKASTETRKKYVRAMFDINLRRELIPDEEIMKDTVGNKSNFRKPHINQTDGMVATHFNYAAKKNVDGNWRFGSKEPCRFEKLRGWDISPIFLDKLLSRRDRLFSPRRFRAGPRLARKGRCRRFRSHRHAGPAPGPAGRFAPPESRSCPRHGCP